MQIFAMVEPAFRHSLWCERVVNGMYTEAKRKKYAVRFVEDWPAEYGALRADGARMVVVVGTSISWIPRALAEISARALRAILVNYDSLGQLSNHSVVRMDYVHAMRRVMGYCAHHGRRRMALLGVNPNSSADRIKEEFFLAALKGQGELEPQRHIFYNRGDVSACLARFLAAWQTYDALLCTNDLVAVFALRELQKQGVAVPERMFLAGFGESVLSRQAQPSITTVTLDHEQMGRQAVRLYAYLSRQSLPVTASIRVESRLVVQESTAGLADAGHLFPQPDDGAVERVDFYRDGQVRELLALESFYAGLDPLDEEILHALARDMSIEQIAEACQASVSTIGYRIRNMRLRAGASSRRELLQRVVWSLRGG